MTDAEHDAAMAWNWPAQTLRDCRMEICEAYYFNGPQTALMAVAMGCAVRTSASQKGCNISSIVSTCNHAAG
jgi:hypothetical protein